MPHSKVFTHALASAHFLTVTIAHLLPSPLPSSPLSVSGSSRRLLCPSARPAGLFAARFSPSAAARRRRRWRTQSGPARTARSPRGRVVERPGLSRSSASVAVGPVRALAATLRLGDSQHSIMARRSATRLSALLGLVCVVVVPCLGAPPAAGTSQPAGE